MRKYFFKALVTLIVVVFSTSCVNAQCSNNKVQMCKALRSGCIYKCVSQGQVQKYLNQGWGFFCNCGIGFLVAKSNKRIQRTRIFAGILK